MTDNLRGLLHQHFDVRCDIDNDPELVHESLKLRYQVYCLERGFENPDEHPEHEERDPYDDRALHSLLIHRASGLAAGTVRLILPDQRQPIGSLPIDRLCQEPDLYDQALLPRANLAEVSRFAISKAFRRRVGDVATPTGVGPDWTEPVKIDRRVLPHLSLGLIHALVRVSVLSGITHWVAEMEPALLRMLGILGIHWTNLGPSVDFHGKRQPCHTELRTMLARVRDERPDIWDVLTDGGRYVPSAKRPALQIPPRRIDPPVRRPSRALQVIPLGRAA